MEVDGGVRRPYRIYREDDPAFAMAGLWDIWEGDDETISCVTVLTTEPNDLMNSIHDRMPVVLPKDDLDAYEILTRINNPCSDDPRVIEPLDHEQSGLGEFSC